MAIKIKKSHEGLLHKELKVPKGEKIPAVKLKKAASKAKKTGNTKLAKQVTFAKNAAKWKK